VAAALLGGLILGLGLYKAFVQPEKVWLPDGWQPAGAETLPGTAGRTYYKQLTREVGGEKLIAVAVPPTQPGDELFYILRDKVTNRVAAAVWEDAARGPTAKLFRDALTVDADGLLPGEWKKGAFDRNGKDLGIAENQAGVPVVNVTLPEAWLMAAALGGQLPTRLQWVKATGARDDPDLVSSAGDPDTVARGGDGPRRIALGLKDGPWPVDWETADESRFGVRQLISNGFEWTRVGPDDQPFDLFRVHLDPKVAVVGQTWDMDEVYKYADIVRQAGDAGGRLIRWDDHRTGIGFRVVLEPR
jgi:hypothetical protein